MYKMFLRKEYCSQMSIQHSIKKNKLQEETSGQAINSHNEAMNKFNRAKNRPKQRFFDLPKMEY